jgi:DNA-dependent RNA polymerase
LDKDISDLKNNHAKYLKGKSYKKLILSMNNSDIIAIVLTKVIPICIKYDTYFKQNITTLFEKIGKKVYNVYYNNEWDKYSNISSEEENIKYKLIKINKYDGNEIKLSYFINTIDYSTSLINTIDYSTSLINNISNNGIIFEDNLSREDFLYKLEGIIGEISEDDFFKLGSDLVEFIAERSGLYKLENIRGEFNMLYRIIVPGPELKDKILSIITDDTDLLPMITQPEQWIIEKKDINIDNYDNNIIIKNYGGFLSNNKNREELIRKSRKNLLEKNDERIINLIKINLHPKTKEMYKSSSEIDKLELINIMRHNSQYYSDNIILQLALLFSDWCNEKDNSLYIPLFIEWRGRIFTNSGYLSYQQSELARSLLLFKDGVKLNTNGLDSLKVYTANCYGLDKKSYNQRLDWTNSQIDYIIKMDLDFIFKASDPLLFIACCYELKGYLQDPDNFISKLPIYKDATCNGLQHLSMMVNDLNLAKYVNILKSDRDNIPEDVYQYMVTQINIKINKIVDENKEYAKLLLLEISRSFIKRGIMTVPYGSTIRGISDQLKTDQFIYAGVKNNKRSYKLADNSLSKGEIELYFNNKEINCLATIIHDILYDTFDTLKKLVTYLKQMNKFLKNLNLNPIWLTPGGLIIEQRYVETKRKIIPSNIIGKKSSITILRYNKDKINLKNNEAIVPNLVHSFDASNISLLIKQLLNTNNNINILTIHDCFATNSNNVDLMSFNVKLAFALLYSNKKFLYDYHNFIIQYIDKLGISINHIDNYICLNNKKIPIPKIIDIKYNNDFKNNILGSQYFIN